MVRELLCQRPKHFPLSLNTDEEEKAHILKDCSSYIPKISLFRPSGVSAACL